MKGKDQMINELNSTVDELADVLSKREIRAWRYQAKSEDEVRWHKEEWVRLQARVAALEAELMACGRPPLKQTFVLPCTSGYLPWQGQKGLGRNHCHGNIMNGD